jgi:predicted membrane metal-binding protein
LIQAFLGLVILAILAALGFAALSLFWGGLVAMPPEILAPMVVTAGTIISVVVTVVGGQLLQRRAATDKAQRRRKVEIYERFMEKWADLLQLGKTAEQRRPINPNDPKTVEYLAQFSREVILWGSDRVLRQYSTFMGQTRRASSENPKGGEEALFLFEKTLLELRRDLGHSNRGVAEGDILRLFVTDIDTVLAARKKR